MRKALTVAAVIWISAGNLSLAAALRGDNSSTDSTVPVESLVVPLGKNAGEGSALLRSSIERIKGLKGYVFESTLSVYENRKSSKESGRFFFKPPNLVRFEVKSGGFRSGAVVVRQPDGKIRGKMGGVFGGLKVTLSPDSKTLRTGNGYSILESDLVSLLEDADKKRMKCMASLSPLPFHGLEKAYLIELLDGAGSPVQRIVIDAATKIPAEWHFFENQKLSSQVRFSNFAIRPDLTDELFSLDSMSEIANSKTLTSPLYENREALAAMRFSGDSSLNAGALMEIDSVLKSIRENAVKLRELAPASAMTRTNAPLTVTAARDARDTEIDAQTGVKSQDSSPLSSSSQRSLLVDLTSIESLLYVLEPVPTALSQLDNQTCSYSQEWQKRLGEIKQAVSRLMDLLDDEKSDQTRVAEVSQTIIDNTVRLEDIRRRASELVR